MKTHRYLLSLWLLFILTACAHGPRSPQEVIDDANALVFVVAGQIEDRKREGLMSKDEAQKELDKVKGFRAKVKEAEKLLSEGQLVLALDRAELVEKALLELQKQVAKKAKEASNGK